MKVGGVTREQQIALIQIQRLNFQSIPFCGNTSLTPRKPDDYRKYGHSERALLRQNWGKL
jgi:hypothetical protein